MRVSCERVFNDEDVDEATYLSLAVCFYYREPTRWRSPTASSPSQSTTAWTKKTDSFSPSIRPLSSCWHPAWLWLSATLTSSANCGSRLAIWEFSPTPPPSKNRIFLTWADPCLTSTSSSYCLPFRCIHIWRRLLRTSPKFPANCNWPSLKRIIGTTIRRPTLHYYCTVFRAVRPLVSIIQHFAPKVEASSCYCWYEDGHCRFIDDEESNQQNGKSSTYD